MIEIKIDHIKFSDSTSQQPLLENIKFLLSENKIYSIIGKNGSGKSTLVKSITRLIDTDTIEIKGEILFDHLDLLKIDSEKLEQIRKKDIRYVFQDAVNSFNPLKKFKYYFNEYVDSIDEIERLLDYFLLPSSTKLFSLHPYEVSGGMAQRINLIIALLAKPRLLILDEPTSAIDTPITNLIKLKLQEYIKNNQSTVLIITQDLQFAKEVSDDIALLQNNSLSDFVEQTNFQTPTVSIANLTSDQLLPGVE